jgi:uncharacterized protein
MAKRNIFITSGDIRVEAGLNESPAAGAVFDSLPLCADASTWGEEIYIMIAVKAELLNPVESVEAGDIAYWPQGPAFCIFFGETPISSGGRIIPAGPVEVIGKVSSGIEMLPEIRPGSRITVKNRGE